MNNHYTTAQLREMPTMATGQGCDLKVQTELVRVWLERTGDEDDQLLAGLARQYAKITVEVYDGRRWSIVHEYHGSVEEDSK